ncbi:hypothetical protein ACQ4PT_059695 [Festuca glaucescens]
MLALDSCFLILQNIYVFGFGVPLFIDAGQGTGGKWGLWILHKLVLTGIYGVIILMYHSSWRDRLPGDVDAQILRAGALQPRRVWSEDKSMAGMRPTDAVKQGPGRARQRAQTGLRRTVVLPCWNGSRA